MHKHPNVLLLILDSTRAQNMGLYGYERQTTPFLERFAENATLYTQARAPSIHSIASHVSMFTGKHLEEHEAIRHTAQIDTDRTIWHTLQTECDYSTGLFTNNRIVSTVSNLGDCFEYKYEPRYPLAKRLESRIPLFEDAYYPGAEKGFSGALEHTKRSIQDDSSIKSVANCVYQQVLNSAGYAERMFLNPDTEYNTMAGDIFTDAFLSWESSQRSPWAACINLMDTHSPYQPAPEFDRWSDDETRRIQEGDTPSVKKLFNGAGWEQRVKLEDLYDGTILQTDAIVRELTNELETRGVLDNTLVILTSDHGDAFGEMSRVNPDVRLAGHLWGIHEVLTHVPLIVKYPEQREGEVVDDVVSLTDLPALIHAVTTNDGDVKSALESEVVLASTFRLLEDKAPPQDGVDRYIGPWRAVYRNHDGAVRKYAQKGEHYVTLDIPKPGEATVLSRDPHEVVETEYAKLDSSGILTERTSEIGDALEEHLEDLGYIR